MAGSENERPAAALPHDRIVPAVAVVPQPGAGSSGSSSAAHAGAVPSRYSNVNLELALRALPPPSRLRGNHDSEVNADVPDLQTSTVQVAPEAGSPGPAAAAPSRPGPSDCPSTDTQPDQAAAAPPACTELALALVVAQAAAPATPIASTNANCNSSSGDATTNTAAPSSASNIRGSSTPGPVPAPAPVGITGDMTAEAVRRQEACVARHLRSLGEHEAREVLEVAGAYKCERCGVRFQDVAALQAHYRAPPHHMCVHCRRDFPAREMYVEHAPTCALYRWPWYPDPVAPDAVVDLCTGLTRRVNVKKRRMEGSAFLTWPWAAAGSLKKAGPAASGSSASTSNISKSSAGQSTAAGRE